LTFPFNDLAASKNKFALQRFAGSVINDEVLETMDKAFVVHVNANQ
tara:strand:- start:37 stop:174 length:138 start_codon:yes stop_codon:yes gene_type:complete